MNEPATILIADISGYTDFVSKTALEHSSHIVNELLELIVDSNRLDLTVSEIEGDAVLFYKKGDRVSFEALMDQCLAMFNAFHSKLKIIERDSICPCGACQGATGLGLKFVAHHGTIREITVANFTKASGLDMIIVHRLLKNDVPAREYVITTTSFVDEPVSTSGHSLSWSSVVQSYDDVGDVSVHVATLDDIRAKIPDAPPRPRAAIPVGDDSLELEIKAPLLKAYMKFIDIDGFPDWVFGLERIEREEKTARIGEVHGCVFDGIRVDMSLVHAELTPKRAVYVEDVAFAGTPFTLKQITTFDRRGTDLTGMRYEAEWPDESSPPDELKQMYLHGLALSFETFRSQLEAAEA